MLESLFDKAPVDVAKFLKAGFFIWLLQWLLLLIQRRPSMTFIECNLNWTSLFWVLIVSHNSLFYFYFLDMAFLMEMLLSKFIEITLRHGCSPVNLLHVFRTLFSKNASGWLLLLQESRGLINFWDKRVLYICSARIQLLLDLTHAKYLCRDY